jgi:ATP-binding cassette subfamily B protein
MDYTAVRKFFVRQHAQTDCGIACLMTVINYFGGSVKYEKLRELSGITAKGTTLLGLYNAAIKCGLVAQGLQADIQFLHKITDPVILHINIKNRYSHFIVCYGYKCNKYIVSNPASGIEEYTHDEINKMWQSKALLKLYPGEDFVRKKETRTQKILWLKELIREDINIFTVSVFLGIVISLSGIVTAVFSKKLIDDILPDSRRNELIIGLILVTVLLFIRAGLSYIHRLFSLKQGRNFNLRITDRFYSCLLRLPKSFFDNRLTGDLVARLNDTKTIQQTISYIISSLIINFFIMAVSGTLIIIYSVCSGIIAFSVLPVYFFIAWLFHDRVVNGQRAVMEAHSENESNYINTLHNIDIIKSMNRGKFFSDINKLIYGFYQQTIYKLGKVNIKLGFITDVTGVIFTIILLSVNSFMVFNKVSTVGVLTAILGLASSMLPAATSLAFANIQLQGARIAFDRMFEFAGLRGEYSTETGNIAPLQGISILTLQNLSFRFPGRKQLLTDISFSIRKGEMIALFGESGCGKTTIINIIQRYYYPEGGKYLINNTDICDISVRDLRDQIAVLPQTLKFFNGSVIENICLDNNKKEIYNALLFCKRMGFERYFLQLPEGYATNLWENGPTISGGQQQLIAFARALYRNPRILLLDEPTSSMDREMEGFTHNILKDYKKHSIILLVTHKISSAKLSDRIYILNKGRIEKTGDHKQLISSDNIYSMAYKTIV